MADFSPMMKQYLETKEKYPGTILFFRLGDFYEMFFEDAKTASAELELTLTGRDCGQNERAPMCGVPFHSADSYIARLVEKGYKVAICEQIEDPKLTKGIVKRDVIRVVTPGTVLESSMLDETDNNYICSLYYDEGTAGIVFADISTGELYANTLHGDKMADVEYMIMNEISRYMPREILINPQGTDLKNIAKFLKDRINCSVECMDFSDYNTDIAKNIVLTQFSSKTLSDIGLSEKPELVFSLGALFSYLKRTQINGIERMSKITFSDATLMGLDINARRNLELTETMRNKEKRGSLLWVLDKTSSAMGKRLIKSWVLQPLLSPAKITARHDAVEELLSDTIHLDEIRDSMRGVFDIERIMSRIVYGSANGRELRSLWATLKKLPELKAHLSKYSSDMLKAQYTSIDVLTDLEALIDRAIVEEPPFTIREGGIIRPGFSPELDEIREDMQGGQHLIAKVEADERERTGIPKLKVGYNRVFGYYIEVTNSYKDKVPENYIRKQTLTSGERYITPELKEIENRVLGASDRAVALEGKLFEEVRQKIVAQLNRVQETADALAVTDVLCSFAHVSVTNDYTRPTVNLSGKLYMKDSRHPVVEKLLTDTLFVPNDVEMDMNDSRVSIITGPNMAGKSTYMRQVAVIVIMAQIGCFVPASSAEIGLIDAIYTRVGASDDLSSGQSTFMLEMTEVADILKNATKDSLLIFDEIGRGTSTFDGMSIAKAVLEYVHDKKSIGAKTLFATHYHELTDMEHELKGVKNFNIAVKKRGDDITFLRKIVRGGADDSYGIEVAKLAGVPERVIKRAKGVLKELESGEIAIAHGQNRNYEPVQLVLDSKESAVLQRLQGVDVNALTPIECMNMLFEIASMLK